MDERVLLDSDLPVVTCHHLCDFILFDLFLSRRLGTVRAVVVILATSSIYLCESSLSTLLARYLLVARLLLLLLKHLLLRLIALSVDHYGPL